MNTKTLQQQIAESLGVNASLNTRDELLAEIERRKDFIKKTLTESGMRSLVLGISGGVDSLTAGLLCQAAVRELRKDGYQAHFIAVRLPYNNQHDEADAEKCIGIIDADRVETVNIAKAVDGLMQEIQANGSERDLDFVRGNVKARMRMIAQYALANNNAGLVVGTDHAAEAVMGFFTKFGDGACDLAPLSGLVKHQVRQIALLLGATEELAYKTPTADLEDLDPGKPDEVAYGCTYNDIDAFLLGNAVDEKVAAIITSQYQKTAHKRALPFSPA